LVTGEAPAGRSGDAPPGATRWKRLAPTQRVSVELCPAFRLGHGGTGSNSEVMTLARFVELKDPGLCFSDVRASSD